MTPRKGPGRPAGVLDGGRIRTTITVRLTPEQRAFVMEWLDIDARSMALLRAAQEAAEKQAKERIMELTELQKQNIASQVARWTFFIQQTRFGPNPEDREYQRWYWAPDGCRENADGEPVNIQGETWARCAVNADDNADGFLGLVRLLMHTHSAGREEAEEAAFTWLAGQPGIEIVPNEILERHEAERQELIARNPLTPAQQGRLAAILSSGRHDSE